jgi:ATP-dependent exoDNAse (exonuclease V) alpha subunit
MSLNDKQSEAMKDVIADERNLYISGPGGTGKSFVVKHIMEHFGESTVLLAPTGIAALSIGGATIHSVFKFPIRILEQKDYSNVHGDVHALFGPDSPVKRIIIDEISMVRADIMEALDCQLRRARRIKNVPFGGIQMIVVGDFYQLPPVVVGNEKKAFFSVYDSPFAFSTQAWSAANFKHIELTEVMRQKDEEFVSHLQNIRRKSEGYGNSLKYLNSVSEQNLHTVLDNDPTFLCSTNRTADQINVENYESIDDEEEHVFQSTQWGEIGATPAPKELKLKVGCKVILVANTDSFKNGEIGYVAGFLETGDIHVVKESDESDVFVGKYTWEEKDYSINSSGKLYPVTKSGFTQYPMKLGWAVTIHKCQGLTLKNGVIDLGRGAFASGQTYVALSRIKSIDGLAIISPIQEKDVIVDKEVKDFYNSGCKGIGLF